jgi:hypothetical protein
MFHVILLFSIPASSLALVSSLRFEPVGFTSVSSGIVNSDRIYLQSGVSRRTTQPFSIKGSCPLIGDTPLSHFGLRSISGSIPPAEVRIGPDSSNDECHKLRPLYV